MICSVLPFAAFSRAATSRISFNLSLEDSPACQRLLHRVMEAGIGLLARHVPLANWKKSVQGSALRSRSLRSMPRRELACENKSCDIRPEENSKTKNEDLNRRIMPLSKNPGRIFRFVRLLF